MDEPKQISVKAKIDLACKILFFAALAVAILFTAMSGVFSKFDWKNFEPPAEVHKP